MMLSLRHPNVVLVLGASWTLEGSQPQVCMVMEPNSAVAARSRRCSPTLPSTSAGRRSGAVPIAQGVASALTYTPRAAARPRARRQARQRAVGRRLRAEARRLWVVPPASRRAPTLRAAASARAAPTGGRRRRASARRRSSRRPRCCATRRPTRPSTRGPLAASSTACTPAGRWMLPAHPTTTPRSPRSPPAAGAPRCRPPRRSPRRSSAARSATRRRARRCSSSSSSSTVDDTAALAAAGGMCLMWCRSAPAADDVGRPTALRRPTPPARAGSPVGDDEAPAEEDGRRRRCRRRRRERHRRLGARSGLATERVVAIPPTERSPSAGAPPARARWTPRPPAARGGGEDPPAPSVFYVRVDMFACDAPCYLFDSSRSVFARRRRSDGCHCRCRAAPASPGGPRRRPSAAIIASFRSSSCRAVTSSWHAL